jgi:prolyl-tRNA synthetase
MAVRQKDFVEELPARSEEGWYTAVIAKAELADYSPVRGCMVIRPYGYTLWENMQASLDARFKATGHRNAYFPIFVPENLLMREAEHVEGFSPEVAWVTHAGSDELEERLAIRPTSETVIGVMYSKWVQSWRDLPILINQWANVVRWEKRTMPFLRTSEFLWQEGHTAHRTADEAQEETLKILALYKEFVETELAIPVITGRKSEAEKFPGADATYTLEALMPGGRALQMGTSHNLGQNFARAFDISFQDIDGERRHAWTTSWGVSTRMVGALIMSHGDDGGLTMPPRMAPIQVVILPIWGRSDDDRESVRTAVERLRAQLMGEFRVEVDWSEEKQIGWKHNEWTLRGAPVRLEIGPRDVRDGNVVVVRRDDPNPGRPAKSSVSVDALNAVLRDVLADIQSNLYARALAYREANTTSADSFEALRATMEGARGFIRAHWCGGGECEATVKDQTGATIRCIPTDAIPEDGACIVCGSASHRRVLFARAY